MCINYSRCKCHWGSKRTWTCKEDFTTEKSGLPEVKTQQFFCPAACCCRRKTTSSRLSGLSVASGPYCLYRERKRERSKTEGGRDGWWTPQHHTRGRPRGHHHQAAPDSSYHAWAALWRAAAGRGVLGETGRQRGEQQGRETCTLSRTDSAVERHVNHQGYYCRAGHGTLQLSETPHWLLYHCS